MTLAKSLAGALVLFPLVALDGARAAPARDIRDWSVSCTGGLTCTMSFSDWTSKDLRALMFRRVAAPSADVELMLSPPSGFSAQGDPDGAYAFAIDGSEVLRIPVSGLVREEINDNLVYADQKSIRALLDAMKGGTRMDVQYKGSLGTFGLPVRLAGVRGSMLFIDEVQDRLKRTDALEAKGELPPRQKMLARDILTASDLPETIRHDFTDEGGACAGFGGEVGSLNGFDIAVGDIRLIVAACGTGGPYNQPYALYMGYDVLTERVSFPRLREGKPSTMSTAYNIDYDPKTRIFTSFFRGRGIGDCGQWYKWKLAERGNPSLVLLETRSKDDCDGNDLGGPQNFPVDWPGTK